jgi:hypothetical protein
LSDLTDGWLGLANMAQEYVEDKPTSWPSLTCLFPHHFIRLLIFSSPKKDRLAETVIPRPLREIYLANHHRLDPVTPFHFSGGQSLIATTSTGGREIEKRELIDPNFVQLRKKSVQELFAKPGSDSATELEFVTFVEADK